MTQEQRAKLLTHLQTAIEIELSTIPIYLYTYYSVKRQPSGDKVTPEMALFANKCGGIIMSVAVEEMLHMALASNIKRSLGGMPEMAGKSPAKYPTNLPHHKAGFSVGLEPLSKAQLQKFLGIEQPEKAGASAECDNWDTIGQFYDCIRRWIEEFTENKDFRNESVQLGPGKGYYAPNNVDTIYPDKNGQPVYPNSKTEKSGDLITVSDKASALLAIAEISHQGEGYPNDDVDADTEKDEKTHYAKFLDLYNSIDQFDTSHFVYQFGVNPTRESLIAIRPDAAGIIDLCNAVYTYLFMMTEVSYQHPDPVQSEIFNVGMHKGMIFVLDKIIGAMRSQRISPTQVLSPTFENYTFHKQTSAKSQLVQLFEQVPSGYFIDATILQRIEDLPDIETAAGELMKF
jgi:hypothetical protein